MSAGRVLLTNGSLQGLAFLAEALFAGSGGRAIVEAPTYDRAILILRRFGATLGSVVDCHRRPRRRRDRGGVPPRPRPRARLHDPELPEPGRRYASRAKRERLVELAQEHRFLVLEDDPYGELRFEGAGSRRCSRSTGGEQRHLLDLVHEDGRARRPHRRDGAAPALLAHDAQARDRHVHRADQLAEATSPQYCAAGNCRARRGAHARRAARATRRAGRRARRPPRRPRRVREAGGRLLPLDHGCPASTPTPSPTAAEARACPVVKGSTCFADAGGGDELRLAYSACPAGDMDEGVARLAALL